MKKFVYMSVLAVLALAFISFVAPAFADETDKPTLYIESYEVDGIIAPGEDIIIKCTLKNASTTSGVNNILLTVNSQNGIFLPSGGKANQYFVSHIPESGIQLVEIYLTVLPAATNGLYPVVIDLKYQGNISDELIVVNPSIALEVVVPNNADIVDVSLPQESVVGRRAYVNVKFENSGDDDIRNAYVHIEGNIGEEERVLDIGVIKAKGSGIVDGYLVFSMTGRQTIAFTLRYEDKNGIEMVSEPREVEITVLGGTVAGTLPADLPGEVNPNGRGTNDGQETSALPLAAGAAGVVLVAIIVTVLLRRRRR